MRTAPDRNLLAMDTSTRRVGLACLDGVQVMGEITWISHDHHTVELAPAIADLLGQVPVKAEDLGALAVALGPGSFTGLRIGLALAKGLALARHLPMVGIPTLDMLAACQAVLEIPMAAVLQAGRGSLAVGWYQASGGDWQSSAQIEVLTPEELQSASRIPPGSVVNLLKKNAACWPGSVKMYPGFAGQ